MSVAHRVRTKLFTAKTLAGAGVVKPTRPDRIAKALKALRGFGPKIGRAHV